MAISESVASSNRICEVCGGSSWHYFPEPTSNRSVTTSGRIVGESLGKGQCTECGFVQRVAGTFLGLSDHYEKHYQTYFDRVGAEIYDVTRYQEMAKWLYQAITPFKPGSILDIGCGRGWMLKEIQKLLPEAACSGVEPSHEDSAIAEQNGFRVFKGKLHEAVETIGKFDLVLSTNVIQHATSAREFLLDLAQTVESDGLIVIICPDATVPGNEMMWVDQNYSFAPMHLARLAEDIGLALTGWLKPPSYHGLMDKQLAVLSNRKRDHRLQLADYPATLDVPANIAERDRYVRAWLDLDSLINNRIMSRQRVLNFGASMWSYLLRAYCPAYWDRVEACVVDRFEGKFMDKAVLAFDKAAPSSDDTIVLGINPLSQPSLAEKLARSNIHAVTWHDTILR